MVVGSPGSQLHCLVTTHYTGAAPYRGEFHFGTPALLCQPRCHITLIPGHISLDFIFNFIRSIRQDQSTIHFTFYLSLQYLLSIFILREHLKKAIDNTQTSDFPVSNVLICLPDLNSPTLLYRNIWVNIYMILKYSRH